MHHTLPHELCEYVYSYLVPRGIEQNMSDLFSKDFPQVMSNGGLYDGFNFNPGRSFTPPRPPPPPPSALPHTHVENVHPPEYIKPDCRIFSQGFISDRAAIEAAKKYYRHNTFSVQVYCETVSDREAKK